jgi:hypothetical protein
MDLTKTQLAESAFAGGEMGARMRTVDWSTTVLGSVEQWPQSLRACVRIVLGAGHPMLISWVPDYTMLYRDAYGVVVGTKHPGRWVAVAARCLPRRGTLSDRAGSDGSANPVARWYRAGRIPGEES